MKKNGFIELNPYDTSKNKSFGYRISWFEKSKNKINYSSEIFHEYELISRTSKIEKELDEKQLSRKKIAEKKTNHLTKWLSKEFIQIDAENAYRWVNENCELSGDSKYQYAWTLRNLEVGNWRYSREGKDNRLHSNLTNLSSNLRRFLSFQGGTLVSLDIKSSQPFLMVAILEMIMEGNERDKEFVSECLDKRKKISQKWEEVFSIMNYKLSEPQNRQEFEVFKKEVVEGDIYNWLANKLSDNFIQKITSKDGHLTIKVYNPETKKRESKLFRSTRDLAKVLFLEFMYSGLGSTTPTYKAVERILPSIIVEFITEFKKCPFTNKKGKKNKNERKEVKEAKVHLSAFLQHFEAFLLLDTITRDLAKDYPNMFMATIHDSIIVETKNAMLVKQILEYRMELLTGLRPEIKYEEWKENKLIFAMEQNL